MKPLLVLLALAASCSGFGLFNQFNLPGEPETPLTPYMTGLVAWYKTSSIGVGDGQPVAQWNDSTVNANHVTQANPARRPTFIASAINGRAAVIFDSGPDTVLLRTVPAGFGSQTGQTIIMAMRTTVAIANGVFASTDPNTQDLFTYFSGPTYRYAWLDTTVFMNGEGGFGPFGNHVLGATFDDASNLATIYGSDLGGNARTIALALNTSEIALGARNNSTVSGGNSSCYIGEVLIYDRDITGAGFDQTRDYLLQRFEIDPGAGGPPTFPGLEHYWNLDETSGDRADAVGLLNMTQIGTVGSVAGKEGNAAAFDDGEGLQTETFELAVPFSIAVWIFAETSGPDQEVVAIRQSGGGFTRSLTINGVDGSCSYIESGMALVEPALMVLDDWNLVVVTVDSGGTLRASTNGETLVTGSTTANHPTSGVFLIGRSLSSPGTGLRMDALFIFNHALSQAQIDQLWNAGAGEFP